MRCLLAFWLALTAMAWAQTSTLEVTVLSPPGATIFVDHVAQGTGQVTLELPVGPHLVRVSAGPEWVTHQQTVHLQFGQKRVLQVSLDPGGRILLDRGRGLIRQGNLKAAERVFSQALETPGRVRIGAFWWLGLVHWLAYEPAPALSAFREYAQYLPDCPELYLFLGSCQEQLGATAEAITAYKQSLLKQSQYQDALAGLPAATDASIAALGRPQGAKDRLRLAQLLMLKGRLNESLNWVKLAVFDSYGDWPKRDWTGFEPPVPQPAATPEADPEPQK